MTNLILCVFLFLASMTGTLGGSDFDRLKALVGEWEASTPEGKARVTYKLISNGTALMETIDSSGENMVSIYHPDGESTLMTHYCASGNQPRMRAKKSSAGDSITFEFVDTTNPNVGEHGVMNRVVIKFVDADHVTEQWTSKMNGKEMTATFDLRRVKMN